MSELPPAFFRRTAPEVARDLIGVTLLVDGLGGRIVETEAYARDDPAAHTFRGPNARNQVMFGPPGRAYVYRSHGLHWCFNTVCGAEPFAGSGVLIRALEPLAGLDRMRERRGLDNPLLLCAGPGRLCQALGITLALNGHSLHEPPFRLEHAVSPAHVLAGRRIGISKGIETPWRFVLAGSRFVSRPVRDPS